MKDERIVYGARCLWWDSIDKAAQNKMGIPCCPRCLGVLYEVPSEAMWMESVERYALSKPGYVEFIRWLRGRCFPTVHDATATYVEESIHGAR